MCDYCEPTLADKIFAEASKQLMNALKEEVKRKLDAVTWENNELKNQLRGVVDRGLRLSQREADLKVKEVELSQRAKYMSISEFLGQREVIMYRARAKWVLGPKCNKCNDDRELLYTTPLGKAAAETCDCAQKMKVYELQKLVLSSMSKKNYTHKLYMRFEPYEGGYNASILIEEANIYNDGDDFADIGNGSIYFREKAQCQAYCDWLNSKNVRFETNEKVIA